MYSCTVTYTKGFFQDIDLLCWSSVGVKLEHFYTDQITFRKKYLSLLFINSSRDVFIFSSVIKMSSPNLNSIIVMGCMLCYAAVILIGLDARFLYLEEYTFICNVSLGSVADCVCQTTFKN